MDVILGKRGDPWKSYMCLEMDNPQQKSGIIWEPDGIHPRRVVWPFGLGDALCEGRSLITIFIVILIMLTM